MSDVEQRLLRAARELRELEVEPPVLPVAGASARRVPTVRIPALALPVLVLLGGLAVMGGTLGRDVGTDPVAEEVVAVAATAAPPAPVATAAVPDEVDGAGALSPDEVERAAPARVLTAHEEVVMIGSLAPTRVAAPVDHVTVPSMRRF